jgi:ABC-type Fe3+/spermidine/putrescine transport system ATPase subunit
LDPATGSGSGEAIETTGAEPTVRLERVSKHFGDLVAVRDLDLDIGSGEFFTLLGPSGCGKTTTLRMVAGFERPTAGRVLIEGEDVAGLPSYRRPTNTVFQSYALFPHLSVRENVAFGLKRKKVPRDEIKNRVSSSGSGSRPRSTASPTSSPAGSSSASRWRVLW